MIVSQFLKLLNKILLKLFEIFEAINLLFLLIKFSTKVFTKVTYEFSSELGKFLNYISMEKTVQ